MSVILRQHEVEVGGKKFLLRLLNVAEGRKVFARMQAFLPFWTSNAVKDGLGPIAAIGLSGGIDEETLTALCNAFGAVSQVTLADERQLALSDPKNMNEAFSGAYEDMFSWLDECVKFNFGGVIEKMKGVLLSRAAAAPEKKA